VRRSRVAGQQCRFASVARAKGTKQFSPPKLLLKRSQQGLGNEAKARSLSSDRFQRGDEQRGLATAGRSAIERRAFSAEILRSSFLRSVPSRKSKQNMDAVQLTRALVDIESTTGAEAAAGEYLFAHLAKLAQPTGGVAERMEVTSQRFNVLVTWGTPVVTLSTHIDDLACTAVILRLARSKRMTGRRSRYPMCVDSVTTGVPHVTSTLNRCEVTSIRSATPPVGCASFAKCANKYSPAAASAPSWTRCPPTRASIAPHPYSVFDFLEGTLRGRNCAKFLRRTPPLDSAPSAVARPRCSSPRWKRSDDSERAFASFPNPCCERFNRSFGGENCFVPFARATEANRHCCPATLDLRTSTKNSLSLLDQSPESNTLSSDGHAPNKSFKSLFCSAAAPPPIRAPLPSPAPQQSAQMKSPPRADARHRQTFPPVTQGSDPPSPDSTDLFRAKPWPASQTNSR